MRIGIFGGSFDPVHYGHLILAERCREEAQLDEVWFIPCAMSPLKEAGPRGTDRQRSEMLEMALAGHDAFQLKKLELERGGVSYTVDTLQEIKQTHPEAELFFLIGDDSLESFDQWREPGTICELAQPLVVNRPGSGAVDLSILKQYVDEDRFAKIQASQINSPYIEISSTDLRARTQAGKSIRYLTPRSVEKYIQTQNLYCGK